MIKIARNKAKGNLWEESGVRYGVSRICFVEFAFITHLFIRLSSCGNLTRSRYILKCDTQI